MPELTFRRPMLSVILSFNAAATVAYTLAEGAHVCLDGDNVAGQYVTAIANGLHAPGHHSVALEGEELASGVCFLRLISEDEARTTQVTLVR